MRKPKTAEKLVVTTPTAKTPLSRERQVAERALARVSELHRTDPARFNALLIQAAEDADASELLRKQKEEPAREAAEAAFEDFCRHFRIRQPSS